jgi:hypothetical protein
MSAAKTFFGSFLQGFGLEGFSERVDIPGTSTQLFAAEEPKSQEEIIEAILGQRHFVTIDLDSLETSPIEPDKLSANELHRIVSMIEKQIQIIRAKKREKEAAKRGVGFDARVFKG